MLLELAKRLGVKYINVFGDKAYNRVFLNPEEEDGIKFHIPSSDGQTKRLGEVGCSC